MDQAVPPDALQRARTLAALGADEAAKSAYVEILQTEPTHFDALTELAALAQVSGHRSAARSAYLQAAQHHPNRALGRVNLGNALADDGDARTARMHYAAALEIDADFAPAHQGMARVLAELGDHAEEHWQRGFVGHAVHQRRYRGTGAGVPLLLLGSARGGNVVTQSWIDDRVFAVTAVYTEFFDPAEPLPEHRMVVNAIGDADLCGEALARARMILARTIAPVINAPARVQDTRRDGNAERLAQIDGVIAPHTRLVAKAPLLDAGDLRFPLLLRAPGFHTGRHFLRVDGRDALAEAVSALPGEALLAIEYLDARGLDGLSRKYRVMCIDGHLYPLHLAISADWKVHYFTSAMEGSAEHRAEEKRFLDDMEGVLGPRAMRALAGIAETLQLDYGGIDFGLAPDGRILLFEANATMVINPADPAPIWAYRRKALASALAAARWMLLRRIDPAA
jgi:hypothetical protein